MESGNASKIIRFSLQIINIKLLLPLYNTEQFHLFVLKKKEIFLRFQFGFPVNPTVNQHEVIIATSKQKDTAEKSLAPSALIPVYRDSNNVI